MTKEEILRKNVGSLNPYWPGQSNGAVEATPGVLKAMDEYAEVQSIAFAEWIESDKCNYMFMASGTWCHTELKTNDLTTQQLYSLYKQSTNG